MTHDLCQVRICTKESYIIIFICMIIDFIVLHVPQNALVIAFKKVTPSFCSPICSLHIQE